jgi:hypothetical protein
MIALLKTLEGVIEAIPVERIIAVQRGSRLMLLWVDYSSAAYPCLLGGDEEAIQRAFGEYLEHYGEKFYIWDLTHLKCMTFEPGWQAAEQWKFQVQVKEGEA